MGGRCVTSWPTPVGTAGMCIAPQSVPCFYLCIYWLCWVSVAMQGLSLFSTSGAPLLLWSVGSRCMGSVVVAHGVENAGSAVVVHGLTCPAACGVFLDQPSNPPALTGGFLTTGPPGKRQGFIPTLCLVTLVCSPVWGMALGELSACADRQ